MIGLKKIALQGKRIFDYEGCLPYKQICFNLPILGAGAFRSILLIEITPHQMMTSNSLFFY